MAPSVSHNRLRNHITEKDHDGEIITFQAKIGPRDAPRKGDSACRQLGKPVKGEESEHVNECRAKGVKVGETRKCVYLKEQYITLEPSPHSTAAKKPAF